MIHYQLLKLSIYLDHAQVLLLAILSWYSVTMTDS